MGRNARAQTNEFPRLQAMGLKTVDIIADGNCLFRSLSDQMYGTQDRHFEVRTKVVDYMRQNSDDFKSFINVGEGGGIRRAPKRSTTALSYSAGTNPTKNDVDSTFERYLSTMSQNREWADNIEIGAFTKAYSKDVRVYAGTYEYCFAADENDNTPPHQMLHIVYHDWRHYSSVHNINGPLPNIGIAPNTQPSDLPTFEERLAIYESTSSDESSRENSPTFSSISSTTSDRSSVKREFDPDDDEEEDIRGPNKRQNRRIQHERKLKFWDDNEFPALAPSKSPSPIVTSALYSPKPFSGEKWKINNPIKRKSKPISQ